MVPYSLKIAIVILLFLSGSILNLLQKRETVTDIDGNIYNTVKIGDQVWMVENLKTTRFRDGTALHKVTDKSEWSNLRTSGYCDYGNNQENANIYGRLYNGYAVIDSRYLAPSGWRIASDSDWTKLEKHLCGAKTAGGKLKEKGISYWLYPNICVDEEFGFFAIPGGERATDGNFLLLSRSCFWWSPAWHDSSSIHYRRIYHNDIIIERDTHPLKNGFGVRCVKN